MWIPILLIAGAIGIALGFWTLRALARYLSFADGGTLPCVPISAELRASGLLRDLLDEYEYAQLMQRGFLDVASPNRAQRVYRIPRYKGLITVFEHGRAAWDLCVEPYEPLPSSDVVLLHKLMIQANEEDYLAHANQFPALLLGQRYHP